MFVAGIAEYLHQNGVVDYDPDGTAGGGNFTIDNLPQSPDVVAGIFNVPSRMAEIKLPYDLPSFQIIVRGPEGGDPRPAYEWAMRIHDHLHGLGDTELPDGTWVVRLQCQLPQTAGQDMNGRHRYALLSEGEIGNDTGLHRF